MPDPIPVKMSQFEVSSPLPSGSYFIVVTPDGSVWNNSRVSGNDVLAAASQSFNVTRWKTPPTTFSSPGSDGDEARDSTGAYYLHTGGVWWKFQGLPF